MAIVSMKKFTVIGIDTVKDGLMSELMGLGIAELNSQDAKMAEERWAALVSKEKRDAEILVLDSILNRVGIVLRTLDEFDKSNKPVFSGKRTVAESELNETAEDKTAVESDIDAILNLIEDLRDIKTNRNKIETVLIGLRPWEGHEIPLEVRETAQTHIGMGIVSPEADIDLIRKTIEKNTELFDLKQIYSDAEQKLVSLICFKGSEEEVYGPLKQSGFSKVAFKGLEGTASDNIIRLKEELAALAERENQIKEELSDMVSSKERIELYHDCVEIEKERLEVFDQVLTTGRTFYFDGWIPEGETAKLAGVLEKHGCYYVFGDPDEDDDPPVLLRNNKFFSPVEVITGLYSLPHYREPDPTPIYALFYICFFGIMFADMGYGIILAAAAFIITGTGKLEGNTYKFFRQLGYCGISAFIWGIVFGSLFGNLVTVFNETFMGRTVVIEPLWFNPVDNVMLMLAFSCLVGVLHLFVALGVKAYILLKKRKVLEAVNDAFLWYVLIIGLGLLLAGQVGLTGFEETGLYLAVIGAVGILVLPVFYAKGISKALGPWKLYGIVSYLADILSYARLLALCLAGIIVAEVFNMLAVRSSGGMFGFILFIFVLIVAHAANFLLNGLGCFVHSIRLQYVEFFGKFFEGNGRPFQPFKKNTRYVRIIKEGS